MRIDQTAASAAPRSLKEQLNRVVQFEEALAQLARLHWAKWDMRSKQLGSMQDRRLKTRSRLDGDGEQQRSVSSTEASEAFAAT